ncbi:hypothetical protein Q7C36_000003 [Tachysurus vachellii]|uniref:Uncharacterized protein n=1 Tax=Tachysurus vachellii TaxID=175792 RepID=A0AA88NV88_TACVA|nr:hypothetical protein Q7C36_000003 [Tachysurus vachellii]
MDPQPYAASSLQETSPTEDPAATQHTKFDVNRTNTCIVRAVFSDFSVIAPPSGQSPGFLTCDLSWRSFTCVPMSVTCDGVVCAALHLVGPRTAPWSPKSSGTFSHGVITWPHRDYRISTFKSKSNCSITGSRSLRY